MLFASKENSVCHFDVIIDNALGFQVRQTHSVSFCMTSCPAAPCALVSSRDMLMYIYQTAKPSYVI